MIDNNYVGPCPECGSDDVGILTQSSVLFTGRGTYVMCGTCAAAGPMYYAGYSADEAEEAKALAAAAWNENAPRGRRPATQQLSAPYLDYDELAADAKEGIVSDPTTLSTPHYIQWLERERKQVLDLVSRLEFENTDLRRRVAALENSNTIFQLERNAAIGRSQLWSRVMSEVADEIGIDHPEARCVICRGHLVTVPHLRAVYAGTNPDGRRRFAHRGCWDNMRDHLWSSYGVSLDALADREWTARQAAKPNLGKRPLFPDEGGDIPH